MNAGKCRKIPLIQTNSINFHHKCFVIQACSNPSEKSQFEQKRDKLISNVTRLNNQSDSSISTKITHLKQITKRTL
jgi:hypothetical protein